MTGTLQMLMATAGGSGAAINFTNQTLTATTNVPFTGQTAQSGYVIRTDGDVDWEFIENGGSSGSPSFIETAIAPSSAVSNYEVRATLSSGTTPSGPTLGSWHALTTDRNWYVSQIGAIGTTSCTLSMQVRLIGSSTDIDTWTVDLIADVTA